MLQKICTILRVEVNSCYSQHAIFYSFFWSPPSARSVGLESLVYILDNFITHFLINGHSRFLRIQTSRFPCACILNRFSGVQLCDPMECSPPGSFVHGFPQTKIMVWVPMPSSRGLPNPWIEYVSLMFPALADGFFTTSATCEALSFQLIWGPVCPLIIPFALQLL